eukprot:1177970-Prorocentrum_minimum.AAC.3
MLGTPKYVDDEPAEDGNAVEAEEEEENDNKLDNSGWEGVLKSRSKRREEDDYMPSASDKEEEEEEQEGSDEDGTSFPHGRVRQWHSRCSKPLRWKGTHISVCGHLIASLGFHLAENPRPFVSRTGD